MKKRKGILFVFLILVVVFSVILYFFYKNNYKTINLGNNINKSAEGIETYILNISSYEANVTIEVKSNKNTNKYVAKQQYAKPNVFKQEIIQPTNIQGLTTIYDGKTLRIENTQLNLSKIYEEYQYIANNALCLDSFIKDYQQNAGSKYEEKENQIIMKTQIQDSKNKYIVYKNLYVDKNTAKPLKMEIQDVNQKMLVYILYNEIKIDSTSKEEILAFNLKTEDLEL